MKKYVLMLGVAVPLVTALSVPAVAQEAGVRSDEIIVTARKRQESVLKVPVVETVLTAETITNNQITNITGITQQVPGLTIGNNVLTVGTQIALRGVGSSSLDAGVDMSVSLNIDGVQLTQGATFGVGMFDMAQIEVLKGPQALFFGKNSPGGVISIRTADPGDETELIARLLYGIEARERRGELIYSTPLSDTVGFRFAGMYSNDDGYFFNKVTSVAPGTGAKVPSSKRYNDTNEYILRGTLVWEPSSDFKARLKINNTKKKIIGGGSAIGSCPDGVRAPAGVPFMNPDEDCGVNRTVRIVDVDPAAFPRAANGGTPFMKYVTTFGTLEFEYDMSPEISLTSTSGYFHTVIDGFINGVNAGFAGPTLIADNHFRRRDYTQELRVQSDFSDIPVDFLIGAFYQDGRVANRVYVGGNLAYGFPQTLVAGGNDVKIKTYSAFGQLRWHPVEQLEIAAGVRYTDEKRHDDGFALTDIDSPRIPVTPANPTLRSKNWSPELTITYTPTDDLTIFGALKQGYKSGSFIMTAPAFEGQVNDFDDERVRGGEVGVKARLFDRALSVNTAFYYYKYDDLQVGSNEIPDNGIPLVRTINAGKSKVYGVDFDLTYRPPSVDGLTARLGINWNHGRFVKFENAPCWGGQTIADGCNMVVDPNTGNFVAQDLSGSRLPKAADWQIIGGIDYDLPVGGDKILGLGLNGQYSSKYLTNLGRRPDFFQPSYFKLNGRIALKTDDDAWELAVIGNNLTNKFVAGNCTNFSAETGQIFGSPLTGAATRNIIGVDELACIPDPGRQIFLRLTVRPTVM